MRFGNVRSTRAVLVALIVLFPIVYLGCSVFFLYRDYRGTLDKAEVDVRSTSTALSEHANRAIGEADRLLLNAALEIERSELLVGDTSGTSLHDLLARYTNKLPQVQEIYAIGGDGRVLASGSVYPAADIFEQDRDYFLAHLQAHGASPYLSSVTSSRFTGQKVFSISRRVSDPDGSLRMVLVASLPLAYFQGFYQSLQLGTGINVMLVHRGGNVILDGAGSATPIFSSATSKLLLVPLFQHMARSDTGSYRVSGIGVDDKSQIVGYASTPQSSLISVSLLAQDAALMPWTMRVWQTAGVGVIAISVFVILIVLLWRRLDDLIEGQAALRERNETLALAGHVFESSLHAIVILAQDGTVLRANKVFGSITGHAIEHVVGKKIFQFRHWFLKWPDYKQIRQALRQNGVWQGETYALTKDQRELVLMQSVSNVCDASGKIRAVVVIFQDITEQKHSERSLYRLAHFDTLTNLPNRRSFTERIRRGIEQAIHEETLLAVIFIDIDHFKTINDSMGHASGDKVLQDVAQRLGDCLRTGDTLARIGGDEFVALLEGNSKRETFEHVAAKLSAALIEPFMIDGREIYVAASMGISVFPHDGRQSESLLRNADTAMYRAKAAGRNCWRFFDEAMAHSATQRLEMETALRRALERNELVLHYQPQRSLSTGHIVGAEALLRWERPGRGMVGPMEFIPLAEESGLISPIGEWVLKMACEQGANWWFEHKIALRVAVNVTARQIRDADFVETVARILNSSRLPPHLLELEITESSIIENVDETVAKLHQLKRLGVSLAIDDFGTGYSSLSYLKQLPVDRLKIDRSFVKDTPRDTDDCAIVRTIIAMSHNLGLSVIAEGVETEPQLDFLREQASDEIQGFLLSIPLPAAQFTRMLLSHQTPFQSEFPRLHLVSNLAL